MAKKQQSWPEKVAITKPRSKIFCSVSAWIRIVQRYIRLKNININDEPLAIFSNRKTKQNSNIIVSDAAQLIKHLAKTCFDETEVELQKYSCHSLQVGACCTLYAAGFDKARIKNYYKMEKHKFKNVELKKAN